MTIAQNLKEQIRSNLQTLIDNEYLGSFVSLDSGKDPLTIDPPGPWPFAMVSMPQISSTWEDQATNNRTYRWDILFMMQGVNVNDGDVEALIDQVLNQFDNNFTLAGVANGAVLPAEVLAWPVSSGDKSYVCFVLTLKARALYFVNGGNLNSSIGFIDSEEVQQNSGTSYTLAKDPIPDSVHLYAEGQRLTVASGDYTISGRNITTSLSWPAGSIFADYRIYE